MLVQVLLHDFLGLQFLLLMVGLLLIFCYGKDLWKITMPEHCPDPVQYVSQRIRIMQITKTGAAKRAKVHLVHEYIG
jgi:hypothetical protein